MGSVWRLTFTFFKLSQHVSLLWWKKFLSSPLVKCSRSKWCSIYKYEKQSKAVNITLSFFTFFFLKRMMQYLRYAKRYKRIIQWTPVYPPGRLRKKTIHIVETPSITPPWLHPLSLTNTILNLMKNFKIVVPHFVIWKMLD